MCVLLSVSRSLRQKSHGRAALLAKHGLDQHVNVYVTFRRAHERAGQWKDQAFQLGAGGADKPGDSVQGRDQAVIRTVPAITITSMGAVKFLQSICCETQSKKKLGQ
jgi:hypothetical protein